MLGHDHATAHELAAHAPRRTRRRRASPTRGIQIRTDVGTQRIGVGDHVETRKNDRRLAYGPEQWIRNHDRWQVNAIDARRGTLDVQHLEHRARITLPADYVARHVRLAYTTTIAAAQGLTVDQTHVVVTPAMYRNELYTALSRGRHANHAYTVCEPETERAPVAPARPPRRWQSSVG